MIGPAGFMQAPNTHEKRGVSQEDLPASWQTIALGQVFKKARQTYEVVQLPERAADDVVIKSTTGRARTVSPDALLKSYKLVL